MKPASRGEVPTSAPLVTRPCGCGVRNVMSRLGRERCISRHQNFGRYRRDDYGRRQISVARCAVCVIDLESLRKGKRCRCGQRYLRACVPSRQRRPGSRKPRCRIAGDRGRFSVENRFGSSSTASRWLRSRRVGRRGYRPAIEWPKGLRGSPTKAGQPAASELVLSGTLFRRESEEIR